MAAATTIVTIATALSVLESGLRIALKAKEVLEKGDPADITEELDRLEAARLRPSSDVIADADKEV